MPLTDEDRWLIDRARKIAGAEDICELTGDADFTLACGRALGQAQHLLGELARRLEELGG